MAKAPGLTREQIDAACALVEAGATFTAAAQQLGVGYGVVRYHMLRLGIASGRTRTQERALSRTVCFRDGRPVWRFTPAEDAQLLALEAQVKAIEDPFLKRGLQMGIDGTDPEELRTVLESEISAKKAEDKVAAKFMNAMGGYAPTIGILGCIVGLMNVMANLQNPETLGPMVSAAFIATLWGVMAANFWFLPMGAKILRVSELQAAQMELLVEGIAEIQAGTSPRAVRQKLNALIPPSELAKEAA